MNIKKKIAELLVCEEDVNFEDLIIESISADKGDYSLPCFTLAKTMHKSPMDIANTLKENLKDNNIIEKCEVVAGYLNFFLNKEVVGKDILTNFDVENLSFEDGKNKTVLIDYGSPNLAKFLHIGHLKTTIIGESLARLFTQFGYNVKRLNFIGDYGTPFGKIIGGIFKWGSMEEVRAGGNDVLQSYYIKFNQEEENDESLQQYARDIFKKIVEKDAEIYPIYKEIIEISLKDCKRMFKNLGVDFDDYRGEMYYSEFEPAMIEMLKEKNMLETSQGAVIVSLDSYDMPPAVMVKSDGTTLYLTRDAAAAINRYEEYKFDDILYVTDVAQSLHFKQLFKVLELAGFDFAKSMEHVAYGRFSLPDGKISSRRGKQAVLVDLMEYAETKAKDIIKDRTFNIENPITVAEKVARAVLNYSVLKVERTKDCVFEVEKAFSFDGETAPYMQYTYTRLESILRKYEETDCETDYSCINSEAFEIIRLINDFESSMRLALERRDVNIIAKKVMDLCKAFNKFYTSNKILDGNNATTKAKIEIVKALRDTLMIGFNLICIDTLQEM